MSAKIKLDRRNAMKAVITVVGRDSVGIISRVSAECAAYNVNIHEITQSVLSEYFVMIMIVDITDISSTFDSFADKMTDLGHESNLEIRVMHEDIFNSMHEI